MRMETKLACLLNGGNERQTAYETIEYNDYKIVLHSTIAYT